MDAWKIDDFRLNSEPNSFFAYYSWPFTGISEEFQRILRFGNWVKQLKKFLVTFIERPCENIILIISIITSKHNEI